MDGGAWWATVQGVTKSRTWLSDFTFLSFITGDWNAKLGSQEIPWVTGKFGLGVQNEAGQRLIEFCQENTLVIAKPSFNNTREDSTHGHHQMAITEIRLIILFAAKDGEALYSQQKQDQELTAAQINYNYKYICTQHGSTAVCKTNANKYERRH